MPVIKSNTTLTLNTEKNATRKTFSLESDIESSRLFNEIFEYLDARARLSDGVVITVFFRAPYEIQRRAEGLVSPGKSSIDDEFAIAADGDETTVGGMKEGLGVDFTGSEVLCWECDGVVILQGSIYIC